MVTSQDYAPLGVPGLIGGTSQDLDPAANLTKGKLSGTEQLYPSAAPGPESILDPLPIDRAVKADAWDAFHATSTPEEFQNALDPIPIPLDAKASLWDMKFAPVVTAPKAAPAKPAPAKIHVKAPAIAPPLPAPPVIPGPAAQYGLPAGLTAPKPLPTPTPGKEIAPDTYQIEAPAPPKKGPLVMSTKRTPITPDYTTEPTFQQARSMAAQKVSDAVDKNLPFLVGPFGIEKGFLKTVAQTVTDPVTGAIIVGTSGLGAVPGAAARVLQTGLSAYFATQAGKAFLQQAPQVAHRVAVGDWQGAAEEGGSALADAVMAVGAGAHALSGVVGGVRAGMDAAADFLDRFDRETANDPVAQKIAKLTYVAGRPESPVESEAARGRLKWKYGVDLGGRETGAGLSMPGDSDTGVVNQYPEAPGQAASAPPPAPQPARTVRPPADITTGSTFSMPGDSDTGITYPSDQTAPPEPAPATAGQISAPETPQAKPPKPQSPFNVAAFTKSHDVWHKNVLNALAQVMKDHPDMPYDQAVQAASGSAGVEPQIGDYKALPAPPEPPQPLPAPPEPPKPDKVAKVGPGTENPPTAALPTEPESPETIALQMQQLAEGTRRVVMFPRGIGQPTVYPPGVDIRITHDGMGNTYAYRGDMTHSSAIHRAAHDNTLPELLGHSEMGMGTGDKTALDAAGKPQVAVVGHAPDGTEAQATIANEDTLPTAVAATHAVTPGGGTVSVVTPEDALGARQNATNTPPTNVASPVQPAETEENSVRQTATTPDDALAEQQGMAGESPEQTAGQYAESAQRAQAQIVRGTATFLEDRQQDLRTAMANTPHNAGVMADELEKSLVYAREHAEKLVAAPEEDRVRLQKTIADSEDLIRAVRSAATERPAPATISGVRGTPEGTAPTPAATDLPEANIASAAGGLGIPAPIGAVHPDIAPYFENTTNDFRGMPEAALEWVRQGPGRFAAGAIPHPEMPNGIGLLHGERGEKGFGVEHIDERRGGPEYLNEAIKAIPSMPVIDVKFDPQTGRVNRKILSDGKRRAVISLDLRGHETPEWLLTEYDPRPPATGRSSDISGTPKGGTGWQTPPSTGGSSAPPSPEGGGAPVSSVETSGLPDKVPTVRQLTYAQATNAAKKLGIDTSQFDRTTIEGRQQLAAAIRAARAQKAVPVPEQSPEAQETGVVSNREPAAEIAAGEPAAHSGTDGTERHGPENPGPLAEVQAEDGRSPSLVAESEPDGGGGGGSARPDLQPDPESGVRPGSGGRSGAGTVDQPGTSGGGRSTGDLTRQTEGGDFRIAPSDHIGEGTPRQKVAANLDAIRVVKTLEKEGRPATPEEQEKLARYVGWGGLWQIFDYGKREFSGAREELRDLLTPEEFTAAEKSIKNAHYTSPEVIVSMWNAMERFGVTPGFSVLEPSMGVGSFFGLQPDSLMPARRTGVELDRITGAIAKALYPDSNVQITGFEKMSLPNDFFDVSIGNVPFGNYPVYDPQYRRNRTAVRSIHNYFFVKSLDLTRPGGIVAFVTSRYTMDAQDSALRQLLASKADLLGMMRLPNTAFKGNAGTEVVTDVVFLRKRAEGQPASGPSFVDVREVPVGGGKTTIVNEYYAEHPEMMLGELSTEGSQYGPEEQTLDGNLTPELLQSAVDRLPQDVYSEWKADSPAATQGSDYVQLGDEVKDGGYAVKDGVIVQREGNIYRPAVVNKTQALRIRAMIPVKTALRQVFATQLSDAPEPEIVAARRELNKTYDAFVKVHGPLGSTANARALGDDPDYAPLAGALENYEKQSDSASKTDIFSKRTIEKPHLPDKADTAAEAMAMVLNERGRLDWNRMQELTGKTPDELRTELAGQVYQNPDGRKWETQDEYLSGNVRQKLNIAEKAAAIDPSYRRNVEALKEVQPRDLTPDDIKITPGAPWIPPDVVAQFLRQVLSLDSARVHYAPAVAAWSIEVPKYQTQRVANAKTFGTDDFEAHKLFDMALNGKSPRVYQDGPNDTRVFDARATAVAQAAQDALKDKFREWIWEDADRSQMLAAKYNHEVNNLRLVDHDGAHLTLPGSNPAVSLRPHQKNVIWRALKTGNTLLAHEVGAGKAQPLDARLLTPAGWIHMGDVSVGDKVIAGDGTPTVVEAVFPQGEKDIFRVEFSDGSSTECCDEHLWLTQTYTERNAASAARRAGKNRPSAQPQVRALSEVRDSLISTHMGAKNHSIPMVGVVQFTKKPVPLDPYLMGVLLGNGCFRSAGSVGISCPTAELISEVEQTLPADCELRYKSGCDYVIAQTVPMQWAVNGGFIQTHPVVSPLKRLGLYGKYSHQKHVPPEYLFNSAEDRLSLLQGLMDADGTVGKRGTDVSFTTTSTELRDAVRFLVQSIGGTVGESSRYPKFTYRGVRKIGLLAYTLSLCLPPSMCPFRIKRKAGRVRPKTKYAPVRYITAVVPIGKKKAQCIRVAHPSHLYVTDDFIVTHNTWELVGIAMESRRLGLAKKPMIAVPNHMAEQFTSDFLQLYPAARVLTIGREDFAAGKRKRAVSRIAGGNWDAVIIRHSSFEKIPVSDATYKSFIDQQIEELKAALDEQSKEVGKEAKKDKTVKEIQKAIARLEVKLENRLKREKKDDAVTFEQLGVDLLLVDEAHAFKALPIITRRTRVAGIPTRESDRATDMYMKTQYISALNGGRRGVVFATGTPVTNTMAELYNMQRYLQPKAMKDAGVEHFDAWANMFGDVRRGVELDVSGKGFRENTRFAKFINIPELMTMYRLMADVKTAEMMKLPRPDLEGGGPVAITAPESPELTAYVDHLIDRSEQVRGGNVDKRADNMLKIVSEGKKAALDMRLVDPDAEDRPTSKVNKAVDNIYRIWKKTEDQRSTQAVFCDLSTPKSAKTKTPTPVSAESDENDGTAAPEAAGERSGFSVYNDMRDKLVRAGVPSNEIAFIHDYAGDEQKQDLFDAVNAGKVRILFGSTEKMGVGTNVQKRMIALHHMDAPWRPADIKQRDGRIQRQGNMHPKVQIYQYITEGSFDAYSWQLLENKAAFIGPILSGDSTVREMEDVGMILPSAAEFKAMASGNPLIKEKIGTDAELGRLDAQRNGFHRQQSGIRQELASLPGRIVNLREGIEKSEADQRTVESHKDEGYVIGSQAFSGEDARKRAAEAMHAALQSWRGPGDPQLIGSYKGLRLWTRPGYIPNSYPDVTIRGQLSYYASGNPENPAGTLASIEATVRNEVRTALWRTNDLAESLAKQAQLEDLAGKQWPQEKRYQDLAKRKAELDAALDESEAEKAAASEDDEDENNKPIPRGTSYEERKRILLANDYAMKAFPDAKFFIASDKTKLTVESGGDVVGTIMGIRADVPEGIKPLLAKPQSASMRDGDDGEGILTRPYVRLMDDHSLAGDAGLEKADAMYEALIRNQPGHVYVNRAGAALIAQIFNEKDRIFGATLNPKQVEYLGNAITAMEDGGGNLAAAATRIRDAVEEGLADGSIITIVEAGPDTPLREIQKTRREETFHRAQVRLGLSGTKTGTSMGLLQVPGIESAVRGQQKVHGYSEQRALVEVGALLGSGRGDELELTSQESVELFRQYVDALIAAHGPIAGTILKAAIPQMRRALGDDYVKARWNGNYKGSVLKGNRGPDSGGEGKGGILMRSAGRTSQHQTEASQQSREPGISQSVDAANERAHRRGIVDEQKQPGALGVIAGKIQGIPEGTSATLHGNATAESVDKPVHPRRETGNQGPDPGQAGQGDRRRIGGLNPERGSATVAQTATVAAASALIAAFRKKDVSAAVESYATLPPAQQKQVYRVVRDKAFSVRLKPDAWTPQARQIAKQEFGLKFYRPPVPRDFAMPQPVQ